jgi:hypothetical protein
MPFWHIRPAGMTIERALEVAIAACDVAPEQFIVEPRDDLDRKVLRGVLAGRSDTSLAQQLDIPPGMVRDRRKHMRLEPGDWADIVDEEGEIAVMFAAKRTDKQIALRVRRPLGWIAEFRADRGMVRNRGRHRPRTPVLT